MNHRFFMRAAGALGALLGSTILPGHAEDTTPRHRIPLQASVDDPALMDLALINLSKIAQHYPATGERVAIDLTTFGLGFTMLRADTSPVKARIAELRRLDPFARFSACQNARRTIALAEGKSPENIPEVLEAEDVPAGLVHLSELPEHGWSYLRP